MVSFYLHGDIYYVLLSLCHTARWFDVWLCFSMSLMIQTLCWHHSMCLVTTGSCWLSTPVWDTLCMSIHWGRSQHASKPSWMRGMPSLRGTKRRSSDYMEGDTSATHQTARWPQLWGVGHGSKCKNANKTHSMRACYIPPLLY